MRGLWLALGFAMVACGASREASSPTPVDHTSMTGAKSPATRSVSAVGPAIAGRVLLDGQPVRSYGVTVTGSFTTFFGPPAAIDAVDGRFRVPVPNPDTWDIIIAGPGFARTVLPGKAVEEGQTLDLGDISVGHGHTIRGVVRDGSGAPLARARVTLVSNGSLDSGDTLAELARGNITTTTDRQGNYRIDGAGTIALESGGPQITASTSDQRWSLPERVPATDATIDLTVGPIGALEVTVTGSVQISVFVFPIGNRRVHLQGRRVDGTVRFDHLPAGEYDVTLMSHGMSAGILPGPRTAVTAGSVTAITLTAPALPTVTIRLHVAPCVTVRLFPVGSDAPIAAEACVGGDAEIPSVEPGHYLACADSSGKSSSTCVSIEVEDSPAVQRFEIAGSRP